MVTARAAPAHERVVRTLRSWDTLFDEVHFVGHRVKAPFLAAAGVQIYFDDRKAHVEAASRLVPAGRVPELPSPQWHGMRRCIDAGGGPLGGRYHPRTGVPE